MSRMPIRQRRMHSLRDDLLAAEPGSIRVSDAAGNYGFTELGKLAAEYRRSFGELPSQTLRHTAARR